MHRKRHASRLLLVGLALALDLAACGPRKGESTPPGEGGGAGEVDAFAGREVVDNPAAKPGDVTICPYSGRKFEVEADSPKLDHGGVTYVFCSEKARDEVAKDPQRYLGGAAAPTETASGDADARDDEPDQAE